MSDLSLLLQHRARILSAIFSSTAFAPCAGELVAFLEHHLDAAQGRAEAAPERSHARSATIRAGIRQAVAALPLDVSGLAGVVLRRIANKGPAFYGLQRVPDIETIRAVLRSMRDERKSKVSEPNSTHSHG